MDKCVNLLSKIRLVNSSDITSGGDVSRRDDIRNNKEYYIKRHINNIDKDDIKKCLEFLRYY